MKHLIPASLILLTACGPPATEYIKLRTDIPAATLTPCPIPERYVSTVPELAALTIETRASAECANGKIEAIAKIVNKENPEG